MNTKIKEKIDGCLAFIKIGNVSFVMFTEEWEKVKSKIKDGKEFFFYTLSNKKIEIIKNKKTGKLQIVDTHLKTIEDL